MSAGQLDLFAPDHGGPPRERHTEPGPGGLRPGQSCRACQAWLGHRHHPACPWAGQTAGRVVNGHSWEWPQRGWDDGGVR